MHDLWDETTIAVLCALQTSCLQAPFCLLATMQVREVYERITEKEVVPVS